MRMMKSYIREIIVTGRGAHLGKRERTFMMI